MAKKISNKPGRVLRFNDLNEAIAEADRLATAEATGSLVTSGNWTFGQTLNHLATWVDYCYDGLPMTIPLPARLIMRAMKRLILNKPMRPGMRLPKLADGTLATEQVPSAEALAHLHRSFARLRDQPPTRRHVAFGAMTPGEWNSLHMRHAELHLSFWNIAAASGAGMKFRG